MSELADQSLYQHVVRPEWGGAVIAWEREGKRGYQFEDGCLRVFAAGHYHLLERIEAAVERARRLRALLGLPPPPAPSPATPMNLPTMEEQVAYFRARFPGGFAGSRWRDDHRGGTGRWRKRHRDAAVAEAQRELAAERLAVLLERRREDAGIDLLVAVLGRTDLVPSVHLQRLRLLQAGRARSVLIGLFDLLHGRTSAEVRMVQWVQALSRVTARRAAWGLATAPLALVAPDHHICVNRAPFAAQASVLQLGPPVAVYPSGSDYGRLLAMAKEVRARLDAAGCAPGDLLDVHDFMLVTLGTAACGAIAAER